MLNTKFYIYLIEKYAKNAVNIHLYMYNSYKIEIMSVEKKTGNSLSWQMRGFYCIIEIKIQTF